MIELREVSRLFTVGGQEVRAMDRVSLTIEPGEYLSIMGPSGSGKSTLLNIIGLLDTPTSGTYLLDGEDVTRLPDHRLAAVRSRKIGFIFQFFHLIPRLTARQNIELPLLLAGVPGRERAERSSRLLESFGLASRQHHRPDELSGGQRQRVAIARAVINEPAVLLADEPTGNLDRAAGHEIIELMEQLNRSGLTLVLVTHDPEIGGRAGRRIRVVDRRTAAAARGACAVRARDAISFALASLAFSRVRTLLMLLAMSIGVAAVVVLTAIGNGARHYVVDQFSSLGTNLVIVVPGRAETAGGTASTLVGETPRDLTLDDARSLLRGDALRRMAPFNLGEIAVAYRGRERQAPLLGSTAALLPIHHLEMARGSFLPEEDMEIARPVCVLGATISRELFGRQNPLGEMVRLGGFRCRVIGVLASQGRSLGHDTEELVVVPVAFAQMLLNTEGLFRILVEARDPESIPRLKQFILDTIAGRHYGEEDITIVTQDSVLATFERILGALTLSVAGIAAISLVVAGILIMNVMLMAVAQRTAEIGLCKAIGASRRQIMVLLVTEALLLSAVGGLLGLAIGLAGSRLARSLYPELSAGPPSWAMVAALGTALATGFVFSLLPARRAARLDPIQALARR